MKKEFYQKQIDKFEEFMVVKPDVEGFTVGAMSV